ncbi:MAG: hypothetical protein V3S82_02685 [Dehalococcoidia bacterium]
MGDIKSAFERAMERADKLGKATPEEMERLQYIPEGEKLAAKFLRNECLLGEELDQHEEKVRGLVAKGAHGVFLSNIALPKNEHIQRTSEKSMEGLKALKRDGAALDKIFSKITNIFEHYLQQGMTQRQEAFEALKKDFQAKLEQAMRQQGAGVPPGARTDVESQPQFQEAWRKVMAQMDSQYLNVLSDYKQEIVNIL